MPLFVSLLHHPVVDRHQQLITASVTNLDLQDIARSAKTFGVERYFVVHPSPDEQALNSRILGHWKTGYGKTAHPTRSEALEILEQVSHFEEVLEAVQERTGKLPICVGTSTRSLGEKVISIADCRKQIESEAVILVFGTGYGLTKEFLDQLDYLLAPIQGHASFNHLSVRSAVAIYLDRLCGR